MAIETQGFAFVTSGKKRESLTVSIFPSHLSLKYQTVQNILNIVLFSLNFAGERDSSFVPSFQALGGFPW